MKKVNFVPFLLLSVLMFSLPTKFFAEENPSVTARLKQKYNKVSFVNDNGLEFYKIYNSSSQEGIADLTGKEILPCVYYYISPVCVNLQLFDGCDFSQVHFWSLQQPRGKYGLADSNGKILIPCIHDGQVYSMGWMDSKNLGERDLKNGYVFLIGDKIKAMYDQNIKEIIPLSRGYTFEHPYINPTDGTKYIYVDRNDKTGLCDAAGKELLPPIYDAITECGGWLGHAVRYFRIKSEKKEGLYDFLTKKIIATPKYHKVSAFGNIYCLQMSENDKIEKVYYANKLLVSVDELHYSYSDTQGRYATYLKNKKYGIINELTGKVLPCQFDTILSINQEGTVSVMEKGVIHLYSLAALESGQQESMASIERDQMSNVVVSEVDKNIPKTKKQDENTFAVIIANENYNDFIVPSATNDGKIFKEYCKQTFGIPSENILYYEDATINNLYAVVKRLKDLAEVYDEGCKIIFYYAGQGVTDEQTKEMYLLPSDGTLKAITSTCYSISKLYKEIGTLQNVEEALFLIDAPFNGMTRENKPLVQARSVAIKSSPNKVAGNTIAVEAAAEGETAHVYSKQNHGLFTYYLLKALQDNKANKSIMELMPDVVKNVKEFSTRDIKVPQNLQIKSSK